MNDKYSPDIVELIAKAQHEAAFANHDPALVDRWEDLVADDAPAVHSWRRIAVAALDAMNGYVLETPDE